jgi:phosphoribosylaminoimidazole-succinocarboxamide synthase
MEKSIATIKENDLQYLPQGDPYPSFAIVKDAYTHFDDLPLLIEGESKIVKTINNDLVIIKLKPTLFSYSANRADVVEGSDDLRLKISQILWRELMKAGVDVGILWVGPDFYVANKVAPCPIEVIVKGAHVGTPKHSYRNMERYRTRNGDLILPEMRHTPYVRFDWRNPLPHKDECLPSWLADKFIDTKMAEIIALKSFDVLQGFLTKRGIEILDICFFITTEGSTVFGEISPDCMRAKFSGDDLDKDLWRKGKDRDTILERWSTFLRLVES